MDTRRSLSFFYLQVNGYAGVDFNQNDLGADDLHNACSKLKEEGMRGILATIITADIDDMVVRLKHLAKFRERFKHNLQLRPHEGSECVRSSWQGRRQHKNNFNGY